MVKQVITNLLLPRYNSSETYEYNNQGNVTKVTRQAENGGTVYSDPFTEYEVTQYDHKPNFMSGNQWLKYILSNTGFEPFQFMMFSKNNAVDWLWGFDPLYHVTFTSTLEYNPGGFASKVNLDLFDVDGVTEIASFTRLSSSTCNKDEKTSARKLQQLSSPKMLSVKTKLFKLPMPFQLTTK
ncbi:MAG: hypothetical protein ABIO55_03835 [Ginsengibacter sp.]